MWRSVPCQQPTLQAGEQRRPLGGVSPRAIAGLADNGEGAALHALKLQRLQDGLCHCGSQQVGQWRRRA